jgi:hypothetical protein
MTFRAFGYWLILSSAAFAAAWASGGAQSSDSAQLPPIAQSTVVPVPEPSRAVFMIAGFVAVLFCYRQAWQNLRQGK